MSEMTHGALFNGIGGFCLAAEWAGILTEWTVEIDPFCNKVSKKHFPHATQHTDIHHASNLPYVDIISGGFPCQPFSVAGKQLGNEDDRALWPQMLRVIREVRPAYVIGENVAGLIGMALDQVLSSLEAEGYATEVFVLPACGVNAPHKRDRVWIIAYAQDNGYGRQPRRGSAGGERGMVPQRFGPWCESERGSETTTNPNQQYGNLSGLPAGQIPQQQAPGVFQLAPNASCELPHGPRGTWVGRVESSDGNWRLTEPPVCGADDGLPSGLVRNRGKQLKAYGNAIVPQVAYELFKAIQQLHEAS